MIKRLLRGERGYSLVEMLTVMVIMSIVFAGVTAVFVAGSNAQAEQDRRFQAQLATRLALDKLRRDIHCGSDVTPYATNSVTIKITGCGGGDVSWCAVQVTGYTSRFALYRQAGTSCSAAGVKIADHLTTPSAFPAFTYASGCGCLASLQVNLTVSLKGDTRGSYQLTDTIFLRNSIRI